LVFSSIAYLSDKNKNAPMCKLDLFYKNRATGTLNVIYTNHNIKKNYKYSCGK